MRQTRYGGAYHCRRCSCGESHTSRRPNEFVAPPTDSAGRFYWLECRGGGTVDAGDLKSSDAPHIMLVQVQPSAPTSLSSAVVNRLPLRAHKEKNALRAGPGAFTIAPPAIGFLSSATDEPSVQVATVSQPNAQPQRGSEGKRKRSSVLNLNERGLHV